MKPCVSVWLYSILMFVIIPISDKNLSSISYFIKLDIYECHTATEISVFFFSLFICLNNYVFNVMWICVCFWYTLHKKFIWFSGFLSKLGACIKLGQSIILVNCWYWCVDTAKHIHTHFSKSTKLHRTASHTDTATVFIGSLSAQLNVNRLNEVKENP